MKSVFTLSLILFSCVSFAQKDSIVPLDKELTTVTYPYGVKFYHFRSQQQDLKMAYIDVRPENYNGKNILLLHGKNFNAAYWEQTIKELTKNGFRVIAPDQIGFGKSTKPLNYQ